MSVRQRRPMSYGAPGAMPTRGAAAGFMPSLAGLSLNTAPHRRAAPVGMFGPGDPNPYDDGDSNNAPAPAELAPAPAEQMEEDDKNATSDYSSELPEGMDPGAPGSMMEEEPDLTPERLPPQPSVSDPPTPEESKALQEWVKQAAAVTKRNRAKLALGRKREAEREKKRKAEAREAEEQRKARKKREDAAAKAERDAKAAEAKAAAKAAAAAAAAAKAAAAMAAKARAAREAEEAQRVKDAERERKEQERMVKEAAKEQARLDREAADLARREAAAAVLAERQAKQMQVKAAKEAREAERRAKQEKAARERMEREEAAKRIQDEEERQEKEEECKELLRSIHHARWELRSMADDFKSMMKQYKDDKCDETLRPEDADGNLPIWMHDLVSMLEKLQEAMKRAEYTDPRGWEIDGGEYNYHAELAAEFDRENDEEVLEDEEDPQMREFLKRMDQLKDPSKMEDEDKDLAEGADEDFIVVTFDMKVVNKTDTTDQMTGWRDDIRTVDDNRDSGRNPDATYKSVEDGGPTQQYIDRVHDEKRRVEEAIAELLTEQLIGPTIEGLTLDSISARPLSAYDAPAVAADNLGQKAGNHITVWQVQFQLPGNTAATREQARRLMENFATIDMNTLSTRMGLAVIYISQSASLDNYLEMQARMEEMIRRAPPNDWEINYLNKHYPDWVNMQEKDQVRLIMQARTVRLHADVAEASQRGAADQRKIDDSKESKNTVLAADARAEANRDLTTMTDGMPDPDEPDPGQPRARKVVAPKLRFKDRKTEKEENKDKDKDASS